MRTLLAVPLSLLRSPSTCCRSILGRLPSAGGSLRLLTWVGCTLLMGMMLAVPAVARDIFVDNVSGTDTNQGFKPEVLEPDTGPCRTIARALELAQRHDKIILANRGVPYYESITLQASRHGGTSGWPFVLIGNGAILDGTTLIPDRVWQHYEGEVFRFRPQRFQYQQLYHQGRPLAQRTVEPDGRAVPELQPLEWCFVGGYVYFRVETDRLPYQYELREAGHQVGITMYEVRHVIITDLVVQGFQLDGVNCHDQVEARLLNLNCRGNGRSGISIGGASRVQVEACLLGNNGQTQLRTEGYCQAALTDCDLIEGSLPPYLIEGGQLTIEGQPVR